MEDKFFNNDVLYMKNLIGKSVLVETIDNRNHAGCVYVIDPVYKTIVLINKATNCLEFLLHHAVKSFTILSDAKNEDFLREVKKTISIEDSTQKKLKLIKWLKHMFINVKEDGNLLRVEDHLVIDAPYGKDECMCDNMIVLERIRNIIDLMPPDFA
ncbi:unnamed protein product [Tenebrio molitor]|nr:unnamed protein product [Tenebrio molitor]